VVVQRLIDRQQRTRCRKVGNLSDCPIITTFNAMISAVDETVHNVTRALKAAGLWDNTLLVWTTDNGAEVVHHLAGCGELHAIPSAQVHMGSLL